jgi:hypothetical protein
MIPATSFLGTLKQSADDAAREEEEFRRSIASRTKALEQERSFAFRRLNLMRSVADAIATAEGEDIAVAAAQAILREKLGWSSDSEARTEVLTQFAAVAQAIYAALSPVEDGELRPDPVAAIKSFEGWYAGTHPVAFWMLFENYIPETPRVDF